MLETMLDIREELLHPIMAHFPIALFVLALFTKMAQVFAMKFAKDQVQNLQVITRFLLFSAPLFFLVTLFLGDTSLDIVKNDLPNLTLAYKHEDTSYLALYFFLGAIFSEVIISIETIGLGIKKAAHISVLLLLIIGNYYLMQTAHLGGMLVYEQGAAVLRK